MQSYTQTAWQEPWGTWQDTGWWKPKSSRRKSSPRRRGDGSWKQGQGKGAQGQLPVPKPPPAPSSKDAKKKGKKLEGAAVSNVPVSGPAEPAESQLTALVAALTVHQDSLPDRVREIVQAHQESNASAQAKALHKSVATQASATKQLAALRARRSQYLVSWRDYVKQLGESLQQQLQEKADVLTGFDSEEAVLLDTIETAKATVLSLAGGGASVASVATEAPMDTEVMVAGTSAEDRERTH